MRGDIGDCALMTRLLAEHRLRRAQFRSRLACGPLHPRPRRLRADQRAGHLPSARECARLLELAARGRAERLPFLRVSTDEVYGTLSASDPAFTEGSRYEARSPTSRSSRPCAHCSTSCSRAPRQALRQAFITGEQFLAGAPSALVLGDNIFYGHHLQHLLGAADAQPEGATVFAYHVHDPERYGVVDFGSGGRAVSIEESPPYPRAAMP